MKVNLLEGKLRRAFFTLFASALGSTIIGTIYASVDIICVGQHSGPTGSAAIASLNPLWSLMLAPGFLVGVGGSIMMSNRKGNGNMKEAYGFFTVSMILSVLFSAMVCALLIIYPRELITFFGGEAERLDMACSYMLPVAIVSPSFTLSATISTFMRNDGEVATPTIATAVGGVINMILDVLLVFTFELGVLGAGLATATGQLVAFLIMLCYFFRKKCTLKLVKPKKLPDKLKKIFTLGASAAIIEIAYALTSTAYIKTVLDLYGENHLAVYGTASTVALLLFCIYNAVGTALQPLASANFGAGNTERVKGAFKISVVTTILLGVLFTLVTQLFPNLILRMFMDVNDEVMLIGPEILRVYVMAISLTGISILFTFYFQSVLKRAASVAISLLRGIILPLIFVFLFPAVFGTEALFYSMPAAECLTFIIAILLFIFGRKEKNKEFSIGA